MLKKIKNSNIKEINGLAHECEYLEKQVHESIYEILNLINSINTTTDNISEISNLQVMKSKKKIGFYVEAVNEEQGKTS